jgi:hypothetical protein
MFTIKLNSLITKRLTLTTAYPLIAELFRKKAQAQNDSKSTPTPEQ